MDEAAEAIRNSLKEDYDGLAVQVEGRRRSVLVRFRDPVLPNYPDFTADVIVAVDYTEADGLHIPRVPTWDRSHPEMHTELVHQAIDASDIVFAKVVRLLKHWNKKHSRPLCSWNIKALALDVLAVPSSQLDALVAWFEHAIEQLTQGETEDPADVAEAPIKLNMAKGEVLKRLKVANGYLTAARDFAEAGKPLQAQEQLSIWLGDEEILPKPDADALADEMVDEGGKRNQNVGVASRTAPTPSRSWPQRRLLVAVLRWCERRRRSTGTGGMASGVPPLRRTWTHDRTWT